MHLADSRFDSSVGNSQFRHHAGDDDNVGWRARRNGLTSRFLAASVLATFLLGACAGGIDDRDQGATAAPSEKKDDKLAFQTPGRPGDNGCDPLDITCQSVDRGNKLAALVNTPKHYGSLSTYTNGNVVSGMFLAGGIWVYVNLTFSTPGDLLHRVYGYDWSVNNWVQIGEMAARSDGSSNYSNFDTNKATGLGMIDKQALILGVVEVIGDPAVTTRLLALPVLATCAGVGTGVNQSAVRMARILVDDIGSRIVATKVESDAWTGMSGKCENQASCSIDLECFFNGQPLSGKAHCEASKGARNQCIRQPNNRKVICTEFDMQGRVIGEAEVECRKE